MFFSNIRMIFYKSYDIMDTKMLIFVEQGIEYRTTPFYSPIPYRPSNAEPEKSLPTHGADSQR